MYNIIIYQPAYAVHSIHITIIEYMLYTLHMYTARPKTPGAYTLHGGVYGKLAPHHQYN